MSTHRSFKAVGRSRPANAHIWRLDRIGEGRLNEFLSMPRPPEPPIKEPPAPSEEPPVKEPEKPPEAPPPPRNPPMEEPPNAPRKPPVEEPPPKDPNRKPPTPPERRVGAHLSHSVAGATYQMEMAIN